MLETLTKRMSKLVIEQHEQTVKIKPEVILEVAYSEIVESSEYEAGYSLRFPAIKSVRDDLRLDEVDTIDKLKAIVKASKE